METPDELLITDHIKGSLLAASASTSSLCSSQYSNFDVDLSSLMDQYQETQQTDNDSLPLSSTSSSEKSLASSLEEELRPVKMPRMDQTIDDEGDILFGDNPRRAEDPFKPINYSPPQLFQQFIDRLKLPYCVQYDFARHFSSKRVEWKDIPLSTLKQLADYQTNEAAAPHILRHISKTSFEFDNDEDDPKLTTLFAKEHAAKSPWKELDREEEALHNNQFGALGFDFQGHSIGWYGGKVLFHGKLVDSSKRNAPPNYKLHLEPATLGPSTMFARRFGSKNFFRLKLTKAVQGRNCESLMEFLKRPLLLCGFVYRAFYAKESNVFYVRTNESSENGILVKETKPGLMSLLEFLDWHNSIHFNSEQKMAKYVSRFSLGLSNSIPGMLIHQSNIDFIEDIISETESNMTDGAGKINRWSLMQIRRLLSWEAKPTAIQVRIYGAKGLLVDDGRNADEFGLIQLTPSQRKIKFAPGTVADPAHRIIDVIRASHMRAPCRLSVEVIVNLAENGVKPEVFSKLLQQSLSDLVDPLLDWVSPNAMRTLWCNVRQLGGVMAARRAREDLGAARALGYSDNITEEENENEDEDGLLDFDLAEQTQRSSAWWGDEASGCPSSLGETIMCLLDSDFTPQETPILRDKLQKFITTRVKEYVRSYRMEVPMSASGFLVPDTEGILEEGEVFFKSSHNLFRLPDGTETDIFVGDVLVTRYPCKLPTDVQKWKSVDRPGLHHLTDVIIFSTKGSQRAADKLGGGDYDGDKGLWIYQPEIVQAFENAPPFLADPPKDIDLYFEKKNEDVVDFLSRTVELSQENQIRERQEFLLADARYSGVVGQYSNFHQFATYTLGYSHPETLRLAHMFCTALDGIKTGKIVSSKALAKDKAEFDKRPPKWKELLDKNGTSQDTTNIPHPRRRLPEFIMDSLMKEANKQKDEWLERIDNWFDGIPHSRLDQDLAAPWNEAKDRAERWSKEKGDTGMEAELDEIQKHVAQCWEDQRNAIRQRSPTRARATPSKMKGSESFTDQPIEVRQDTLRRYSKVFASFPRAASLYISEREIARIRASCAYLYDYEQKRRSNGYTSFPWDVAMRELCAIKAQATGRWKTVSGDFYDHFNIKHPKKHQH